MFKAKHQNKTTDKKRWTFVPKDVGDINYDMNQASKAQSDQFLNGHLVEVSPKFFKEMRQIFGVSDFQLMR